MALILSQRQMKLRAKLLRRLERLDTDVSIANIRHWVATTPKQPPQMTDAAPRRPLGEPGFDTIFHRPHAEIVREREITRGDILAAFESTKTLPEMALKLNRETCSMWYLLKRFGLSYKKLKEERRARGKAS